MEAGNKKENNEIENINSTHLQDMKLQYYKELSDSYQKKIKDLEEALSIANSDLDYIKTQNPKVWKKVCDFKSKQLSNNIRYEINEVKVNAFSLCIEGFVISTKGQEVIVKGGGLSNIKRSVRKSVNIMFQLPENYQSGFV